MLCEGSPPPKDHSIKFGGDPDSQSGIRIRNMNFLKSVIARELFVIRTCNRYQAIPKTSLRQIDWRY